MTLVRMPRQKLPPNPYVPDDNPKAADRRVEFLWSAVQMLWPYYDNQPGAVDAHKIYVAQWTEQATVRNYPHPDAGEALLWDLASVITRMHAIGMHVPTLAYDHLTSPVRQGLSTYLQLVGERSYVSAIQVLLSRVATSMPNTSHAVAGTAVYAVLLALSSTWYERFLSNQNSEVMNQGLENILREARGGNRN